jgi:YggT family protein
MVVAIDVISAVQNFFWAFTGVYTLAILAYVLTSWVQLPYSLRPVQRFLYEVCEPYIRLWRRVLPSFGAIDLSPMVAVLALWALDAIVNSILGRFH